MLRHDAGHWELGVLRFHDLLLPSNGADDATLLMLARADPRVIRQSGVFKRAVTHRPQLCDPLLDVIDRQCPPSTNSRTVLDLLRASLHAPRELFMRMVAMSAEALGNSPVAGRDLLLAVCENRVLYKISAVLAVGVPPTVKALEALLRRGRASTWGDRARAFFAHDHAYSAQEKWDFAMVAMRKLRTHDIVHVLERIRLDVAGLSAVQRAKLVQRLLHNCQGSAHSLPLLDTLLDGVTLDMVDMTFVGEEPEPLLARRYLAGAHPQLTLCVPANPNWTYGEDRSPQPLSFGRLLPHLPPGASIARLDLTHFGTKIKHMRWIVRACQRTPILRIDVTPNQLGLFRMIEPPHSWSPGEHARSHAAVRAAIVTLLCLRARRAHSPAATAFAGIGPLLVLLICARVHAQHHPWHRIPDVADL